MVLIAIDTSGRHGSIALCRGDQEHFDVLQLTSLEGGMYSSQLMPAIAGALEKHQLSKSDIEGFVIVSGPGSFTGLRVGLSTVKALCEVLQKPLAAVSMLEAIALTYASQGETVTGLLDAGRGEIFAGEYHLSGHKAELLREYITKIDALSSDNFGSVKVITPDAKVAESLRSTSAQIVLLPALQADAIARIGLRKLLGSETSDPATLDANYIRRSDAELFAPKR